jgi:GT2 family glycosyltransferase
MKKVGIILVNYRDYAKKYLDTCLESILKQDYKDWELAIVDNDSSEETYSYLKEKANQAKIIRNFTNDGFAKGNNDAIKYFLNKNFSYIYLLNMDAYLEIDALKEAVLLAENDNNIAAVQSRLMLSQEKERVNSLGNASHFLGFGYCLGYKDFYHSLNKISDKIAYFSGAAVLLRSKALSEVGLFDEELFMYNEDQDLGWRFWLAGWQCQVAYNSVAYHDYEFSRSISKYYYMDRNRIIVAFKNYSSFSLFIFFPAFLFMEVALLFFAVFNGWWKKKLAVWRYFLSFKNIAYLSKARQTSQKLRKVKDREILTYFSGKISYQEIDNICLKYIANPVFSFYFKISYYFIKIFNI